ncbi:MAG TPA: tRNA pseudouridine(55) synthase TruB [Candidatus Dormibacteraeota bacterium]|jgi:tRNA pseudouridine55 synthase|nr:tRNA pseudouridine(55) synthase TruB [Candidatus Dormibacteraeota bacterium]
MGPGVLNVDKPAGVTSFTVVRQLRSRSGAKRVGHAGTLDPLATGVLPILFESATRLSDYAHKLEKAYEADVHLGFTTITDDAEADPEPVADPSGLDEAAIVAALAHFVGRIEQQPPAFSAVKVDGERAYKRARAGDLERPAAREVEIYGADLLDFTPGERAMVRIRVRCASGVYLRSLARDLGAHLGVGGYLGQLVRTAYGGLTVTDAVSMDDLEDRASIEEHLQPPELVLPEMAAVRLSVEQEAQVRRGQTVRVLPPPPLGQVRAHDQRGRLVALGHADPLRRTFVPDKVLA